MYGILALGLLFAVASANYLSDPSSLAGPALSSAAPALGYAAAPALGYAAAPALGYAAAPALGYAAAPALGYAAAPALGYAAAPALGYAAGPAFSTYGQAMGYMAPFARTVPFFGYGSFVKNVVPGQFIPPQGFGFSGTPGIGY